MEFPFYVSNVLKSDDDGFSVLDGTKPMQYRQSMNFNYGIINAHRSSSYFGQTATSSLSSDQQLDEILDKMGMASAKAQKLSQPITTGMKLFNSDNRVYIRAHGKQVIGFIKVGKRNLFIRGNNGGIKEIKPLCVLDFYVHESMQRGGHGRALFDKMLEVEKTSPEKLAYDRPSDKLIAFLAKHFHLKKYIPQNNNFVVYDAYFDRDYQIPYNKAHQNPSAYERFNQSNNVQQENQFEQSSKPMRPPSYRSQRDQENMRNTGFKNQTSQDMNNIFGQSNQQNMLPPRHNMDNRDPRFSSNSSKRELGPRKLSNTGIQVLNNNENGSQNRYMQQAKESNQSQQMKQAYQNSVKEKQSQVYHNGSHQGFSDDRVQNLMNIGYQGPLDHANNDSRRDVNNHRMDRMNGKINSFDNKIKEQEAALQTFSDQMMHKHATNTVSNVNSFYGKGRTNTNGFQTSQDLQNQSRGSNFQTDKNWNHKQAVNQLYNKRDQNSYELYQQNQDVYWKRAEVDKNMVQYNKKINDGEVGRVPWGTGYSNQMKTSNSQFGQHYSQAQHNGVQYYARK